jgi:CRP-like cAMP-binding protein
MSAYEVSQLRHISPARLRRLRFFGHVSIDEARHLAGAGNLASYRSGEYLATEGTRKQRRVLYVVVGGTLEYVKRIRTARASVVLRLGPGDAGGFLTYFNDDPSPVSVRAVGRTTVFEIGRREVQTLGERHPALAAKLLGALAAETAWRMDQLLERMATTAAWALDLAGQVEQFPLDMGG